MAFSVTETIGRPRAEVWAAAIDWSRAPQWMKGVEDLRALEEGSIGEGTKLAFHARGSRRESTIVSWNPEEALTLRSHQGGMTADYAYRFEECDEGTRVVLDAECHGEGFGWRLAAPLVGFLMARADSGQLRELKRMVEASS